MSKTTEQQIEKSRGLIAGLRKHLNEGGHTATAAEIDEMERALQVLSEACEEVERLRAELSPKVKHMNDLLAAVKATYADKKKTLKGLYPPELWGSYGVPDKR